MSSLPSSKEKSPAFAQIGFFQVSCCPAFFFAHIMPVSHYRGSFADSLRIPLVYAITPGGFSGNPQGFPYNVTQALIVQLGRESHFSTKSQALHNTKREQSAFLSNYVVQQNAELIIKKREVCTSLASFSGCGSGFEAEKGTRISSLKQPYQAFARETRSL